MSEEMHEVEAGAAVLPTVGAQLVAAREAKGLAVADIAQTLKLGIRQVEALEKGDWGGLPGATFIRGFVRNYARLVQVDAGPLMAQLDQVLEPAKTRFELPETEPATMPMPGGGQRRDYAVAMFGLALVVAAIAVYFLIPADFHEFRKGWLSLLPIGGSKEVATVPSPAAPEPMLPPGATAQQVLYPQAVTSVESLSGTEATNPAPVPLLQDASPTSPSVAGEGPAVLRFVVDRESWVEVRGGDGKVIFSQKVGSSTEQAVGGKGPFAVVVGNAPGVRVLLRGQPVDLAPYTRGDVARLTLD